MGAKRVLVPIGTGSEEIEAATAVDVLRRAGADVVVASAMSDKSVTMSRGLIYQADTLMSDATGPFDAVAVPGGMPGAENLRDCEPLTQILRDTRAAGGVVAAICAAPAVVLAGHGLLDGVKATCYPAPPFKKLLPTAEEEDVVVDGKTRTVTGTGPGTALPWALKVVEVLYDDPALAEKLAEEMLVK